MHKDIVISVTGLGYVGLPVAIAFSSQYSVIGYDKNELRISELKNGFDKTNEIPTEKLLTENLSFTHEPTDLKKANFHIIAVPTPIDAIKKPDLSALLTVTETIAQQIKQGDIIVYESTVYPGTTEEKCIPLLEKISGLYCGKDFSVGYSPERINPGDPKHTFTTIKKIISASDEKALEIISRVYENIVVAGIHLVKSIKIAEAAKIIENTQRDLNIALMNELAIIFNKLNIDTLDVIEAASTKWNFLPFKPGLVGGHCIGVDPYYLTYKAEQINYHPEVILAGRRINDNMGKYIVEQVIKTMLSSGTTIQNVRMGILGLTFKENCSDLRNSKVIDIINELKEYGIQPLVHDPLASPEMAHTLYQLELSELTAFQDMDAIIIAVSHDVYKQMSSLEYKKSLKEKSYIFDVKGILNKSDFSQENSPMLWRL